jgi:hypothetical protein
MMVTLMMGAGESPNEIHVDLRFSPGLFTSGGTPAQVNLKKMQKGLGDGEKSRNGLDPQRGGGSLQS